MALTYQQIWERYSTYELDRKLYLKRLQVDGTYEDEWNDISAGITGDSAISRIQRSLPNSSHSFGAVKVPNANITILSAYREFSSEAVAGSIFNGYIRHLSKIKVVDSLLDKYTDPDNPEWVESTTFEGLIDGKSAVTESGYESFSAMDLLSVLNDVIVGDLNITSTNINDIVFEVLNRTDFTKYFNVSASTTYIDAGYNATSIDISEYATSTVFDMFQDLSKGHSLFYVDPDDNYFYFKESSPTAAVQFEFLEKNDRKISIKKYKEGRDRQVTAWYWSNSTISSVASVVSPIVKEMAIDGVTEATQQQGLLDFVLSKTRVLRPYFELTIPFFPIIRILDKIIVQHSGDAPKNAIRWGMFLWTESDTANQVAAPKWSKAAGIKISAENVWMVRSIKHDGQLKTTLELEFIS